MLDHANLGNELNARRALSALMSCQTGLKFVVMLRDNQNPFEYIVIMGSKQRDGRGRTGGAAGREGAGLSYLR